MSILSNKSPFRILVKKDGQTLNGGVWTVDFKNLLRIKLYVHLIQKELHHLFNKPYSFYKSKITPKRQAKKT
jgi:hypothetical protein